MSKDYIKQLNDDTIQQFKGKKNIEALNKAVGRQLNEVLSFYKQLNTERSLSTAYGAQLDAIGDILGLTRKEAYNIIGDVDEGTLRDSDYRSMLAYKIILNFGHATYYDIVRGIRKFYNIHPVRYLESLDSPAAFSLEIQCRPDEEIVLNNLIPIKAAGVDCRFEFGLYQRVEASSEISGCTYDVPVCGKYLCGTYPIRATLGNSQSAETDASSECDPVTYEVPITGTLPDISTLGGQMNAGTRASGDIDTATYYPRVCGVLHCGQ